MKRTLFTVLIALIVFVFSACGTDIQSVDLSQITFDGVAVGDSIDQVETEKYTEKSNVKNDFTYNFEEWSLLAKDGTITEIKASFGEVTVSINETENCTSVDDITSALGENCKSSWYDKEQGLMQLEYSDKENGLKCSFVYDKNGNNIVWGIMQKN